ncbi:unnamed protein product [Caenorhabditis bovis]|uniref:SURF4-domain-containing protein n=1 Tax=Caenorhabditis bovis TaxID=2654633 RepID=A0A8S1F5Q8_9PELO|nr:unnamed protein product [Caenorhabditis bovis]
MDVDEIISYLEIQIDDNYRVIRPYVPLISRLLLCSTFFEDGFRMLFQFSAQIEFGMVLVASANLLVVLVMQVFLYYIYTDLRFLARTFSIAGGIAVLLSESFIDNKSTFARVPTLDDPLEPRSIFLLVGRIYLIGMITSLIHIEASFLKLIEAIVSFGFLSLLVIGYKTKLVALILATWLFILNFFINNWWSVNDSRAQDYTKFDFFQVLSVVGGLLLLVQYGPGGLSIDDQKKQW